jgi:formylglycine-generating enzyme required for sulfatase activity
MLGNVAQWCQDWENYSSLPTEDPLSCETFQAAVRGGGLFYEAHRNRAALHFGYPHDARNLILNSIGFRIVMVPVSKTSQ